MDAAIPMSARTRCWSIALVLASALFWSRVVLARIDPSSPLLLRDPAISRTQIAFSYAGYIWVAQRDGTGLRQLTSGGHDRKPRFSPDGSEIAYTAGYEVSPYAVYPSGGIFVVSLVGGKSRQLTFHPLDLEVADWSRDGANILFSSRRNQFALHSQAILQLFSVPASGGPVSRVPLPRASEGAISPDMARIAYVPNVRLQPEWKQYRGGQTTPIWIARLRDSLIEAKIPRENSNDFNPMWHGDTIYFLSDRNGAVTLFAYSVGSHQVRQVLKNSGLDIKSASATDDAIIYEQFGALRLFDLTRGEDRALQLRPDGYLPQVALHEHRVDQLEIQFAGLSPSGDYAVFGARGDVFTVSAANNMDLRNVTHTMDIVERDPTWSPDGRALAYFSDESGEYALHVRGLKGVTNVQKWNMGRPGGFYYDPIWSPNSLRIGYTDQERNIWYLDLKAHTSVRIDTDVFATQVRATKMSWSPDGRWIAYTKELSSHLHAIFLYSVAMGRSYQVTASDVDAQGGVFDRNGDHLYFTASTDAAPHIGGWNDMSRFQHPVRRGVYSLSLDSSGATSNASLKGATDAATLSDTDAELHAFDKRIARVPAPEGNFLAIIPRDAGVLYLVVGPSVDQYGATVTLSRILEWDTRGHKLVPILDDIPLFHDATRHYLAFTLSQDGRSVLYCRHGQWFIARTDSLSRDHGHSLDIEKMSVSVDPRREWKHMYEQVWRAERDFFYDQNLHGIDFEAMKKKYQPYLANLSTRADLNYLFSEMLGNLVVGHMLARGGDDAAPAGMDATGLLGADYSVDHERYRFAKVYRGDIWSPQMFAPLAQTGREVNTGEYLINVDGQEVRATKDVYSFFANSAGKQIALRVGPTPDGRGSRQVVVTPIKDEASLRYFAWVENNQRRVEELSRGSIAYVHLPDTGEAGFSSFNRSYFAQVGRSGAIIDERYNQGGAISDYVIDYLSRRLMFFWKVRYGEDSVEPQEAIFGPKVMIINEMVASGGDALAWMFRKQGIGPLVGTRTWGGLISATYVAEDLLDGGVVSTPNFAPYSSNGRWEVENSGVAPDIEVEEDPHAWREGHDPQLEKAVALELGLIKANPSATPGSPPGVHYIH
jgi:tricorn protease